MQDYYRKRAGVYDESMGYDRAEVVAALGPVIDFLGGQLAGRRVLEIACGPGFWTAFVARRAESILATDYNEETLVEARKKDFAGCEVSFRQADAYRLPELGRVFDGSLAVDWFCHVPKRLMGDFLTGLHARLEPRARIVFGGQLPKDSSLTGRFDEEGNHLQERTLPDGSTHAVIKNFFAEEELRALLTPRGGDFMYAAFPEVRRYAVAYTARSG